MLVYFRCELIDEKTNPPNAHNHRRYMTMKKSTLTLPAELKHILATIEVTDYDTKTVEKRMKERAATQVQDYIEIVCRKLSQFHGVEISTEMNETMQMLQKQTRPRTS
jgi:hypothetical protein